MGKHADVVVVGAGILGLAHAWHCAREGLRVVVVERSPRACGASVRNFGMVWPVGQRPGTVLRRALRSRDLWLQLLPQAGLWHHREGSLHIARQEDEWQVLQEFAALGGGHGYEGRLVSPGDIEHLAPGVLQHGLLGGYWSPTEVGVDPRQVVARLPAFLAEHHGVEFRFSTAVTAAGGWGVRAGGEDILAGAVIVCGGTDFETLYPAEYRASGLLRCKLQMMRTAPQPRGWRLGPMIAGGLTLVHYDAFGICPSRERLRENLARELPLHTTHGIHVMAAQNEQGEVVIGDSHEHGLDVSPFDDPVIDELVLDYLGALVELPDPRIAARWNGVYARHPDPSRTEFILAPEDNVRLVSFTSGNGMTTSLALAEEVLSGWLLPEEASRPVVTA